MYKLDIAVDTREAAAIERRRNMERQRQSRIFNARERTIGIDKVSLDLQVEERKQREEMEDQRDAAFASEMIRNDKITVIMQQRQENDIRELNKSLLEYRKENQRVQDRREFDLNDPDTKKKDLPTRVSDADPRLSTSGMQKFSGEDLDYEERKKYQQEQMREWTKQQIEEKDRLEMEQCKANQLYNNKAIEVDQRAVELSVADTETRKAINVALKDYNKAMAKEKSFQKKQEIAQEQDDNYTEISNHINGDLLTENPQVAQSAFGSFRVIPDRWKGMSPSEVADILQTQQRQCEEKQILMEEQKRLDQEWDRRRLAEARAGLVKENEIKWKREELRKVFAAENKQLAEEQRAKQRVLNTEVYVNRPDETYFSQFGTSSR